MKKRIRGLILPIPLLLAGQTVQALGLGELKVESALKQPLKGQIRLILNPGESLENLQVKLAGVEDYERVGLDPTLVPPSIQLAVRQGANGAYIEITSSQPVNEPIVSLLLEADWPKGRLLREYTLLLDPPSYAPVATVAPARLNQPESFDDTAQEQVTTEPEPTEPEAPVAPPPALAAEEANAATAEEKPALTREFPVEAATPAQKTVTVTAGSTLWSIASQQRSRDVSVHQMMVAILRANPEAFLDGNMNRLKKGSVLHIPAAAQVRDISREEALAEVASQSQQWVSYQDKARGLVPSAYQTESTAEKAPSVASTNQDYKLDLVPPAADKDSETRSTGSVGETDNRRGDEAALALAREDLATLEQEKQELASRIEELESIVNDQQAVLQMKDADLAKLQQQLAALNKKRQALEDGARIAQENLQTLNGSTPESDKNPGEEPTSKEENTPQQAEAGESVADTDDVWGQEPALAATEADSSESASAKQLAETSGTKSVDTAPEAAEQPDDSVVEEPVLVSENSQPHAETTPVGSEERSFWQKMLDWISANPLYAAGAALLLLLLGLLPKVLRRKDDEPEDSDEGSFLDSIAVRAEKRDDQPEVSIEELLERIEQEPDNVDLLYEAALYYYGENDQQKFENMAEELYGRLADPGDSKWQEIAELGRKIAPENALFGVGALTEDQEVFEEDLSDDNVTGDTLDDQPTFDDASSSEESQPNEAVSDDITEEIPQIEAETTAAAEGDFEFDLDEYLEEEQAPEPSSEHTESTDNSREDMADNARSLADELDTLDDVTSPEAFSETLQADEPLPEATELDLSLEDLESELESISLDEESGDNGASVDEAETPVVDLTGELDIDESEDLMDFDFGEDQAPEKSQPGQEENFEPGPEESPEEDVDLGFNLDDIVPEGDAVATKLDLARAYYEMGDIDGARIMLDEVIEEGNAEQQAEARKLREEMDGS